MLLKIKFYHKLMANIDEMYYKLVRTHLLESSKIKQQVADQCIKSILAAIKLIIHTFNGGNKVLICGNGGSAADSQHMAGEFVCMLNKALNRPGLPAIALTTDTSILTAYANDIDFNKVFERQLQALGQPGDLLIGISTSGNSANVIFAMKKAKISKMQTVALIGHGGKLAKIADIAIAVPSANTQYIQESHIAIEHIICELVEYNLFSEKKVNKKDKLW